MQLGQERKLQRQTMGQKPSLDTGTGIHFVSTQELGWAGERESVVSNSNVQAPLQTS